MTTNTDTSFLMRTDGWMDGWIDEWMDGWMGGWMDGWVEEEMNG